MGCGDGPGTTLGLPEPQRLRPRQRCRSRWAENTCWSCVVYTPARAENALSAGAQLLCNDLVVSMADCSITDDTIYVKIPFVRPLRDSLATADSLFFAPRRIFAWARIIKGRSQPELRFIELDPTRDYHKVNRTRIRYQAFSGEMNFFNEDGTNEYSAVWVDGHIVSDTLRQSPVDAPKHGRRPDRKARRR